MTAPPASGSAHLPHLQRALENRNLLIFAGAGISKLQPSLLPDWYGFNRMLLEAAKETVLRGLSHLGQGTATALQQLVIEKIPVEAFSDLIVRSFASDGYFSLLDILDSDQTNLNHRALAELAKRGILRVIVTTNFDTLIERAFKEAQLPLQVITAANAETAITHESGTVLLKIHGSVTDSNSLVDTVSQKIRGLSRPIRSHLEQLFQQYHVLVLGYSGADLKFGKDYLAFSALGPHSKGVTWLNRPGTNPPPEVVEILTRLESLATLETGALPDFFDRLGISLQASPHRADETLQEEVDQRTRSRVRRFYDEPYVGPLSSAAFCAGLLYRIGETSAAAAMRNALAEEVDRWQGSVPKTGASVLRTLAVGAMQEGNVANAERWIRHELAFWQAAREHLRDATPEIISDWARNFAAAWMNLAVVQRAQEQFDDARQSLQHAVALARDSNNIGLRAVVFAEAASLGWQTDEPPDNVIEWLRQSISAATEDGAVDRLSQSRTQLARILIKLGEYDLAWAETEYAARHISAAVREETVSLLQQIRAEIRARRGNPIGAVDLLKPWLDRHPANTRQGAAARATLARTVAYHLPLRPLVIEELDRVLAAMREGLLPERGLSWVPDREELDSFRELLLGPPTPAMAELIQVPGADAESYLRAMIVLCEFTGFRTPLPALFAGLARAKWEEHRFLRVLDLAHAVYFAATRGNHPEHKLLAILLEGACHALLGGHKRAIETYQHALATATAGPLRDAMEHNLVVLQQSGADLIGPEALRGPTSEYEELTEADARVLGGVDGFLRQNDLAGAIELLRSAAPAPN